MAVSRGAAMGSNRDKTAVVMIHGMGEQRPMETLRGFVESAWVCDPVVGDPPNETFSKPDDLSGSFELRRITTLHSRKARGRADFFEYYWAHQMTGTKAGAVFDWLRRLLFRKRGSVPERLLPHWRFGRTAIALIGLWASATLVAGLAVLAILLSGALILSPEKACWLLLLWGGAFVGLAAIGTAFRLFLPTLVRFVGDAARYFSPLPDNIAARHAIRQGGVELIRRLHERDYGRIIVASHSLGTVVAYDVLTHAWAQIGSEAMGLAHAPGCPAVDPLKALEAAAGALAAAGPAELPLRRRAFREAQRLYAEALGPVPEGATPIWRVTDFVTMGSPLSKADVLIAYEPDEWDVLKRRREAPTCPPWPDKEGSPAFSYDPPGKGGRIPHHAAPFAATVWTNIFFANEGIYKGDVVGGEVAPMMGPGVLDIRLERGTPTIRHTHYWSKPSDSPTPPWIRALRAALRLWRRDEATLWGGADEDRVVSGEKVPG